ncbi:MAG: helix-turn-helix domain-containing protein [Ruminococcus sp.]|nr:helix-turn-helix domain-containing protein [Ruminococcus sp.]
MIITAIPLILKYVRMQHGYTQEKIAEILNTSKGQVNKYESENPKTNQEIPVRHIVTLAKLYNVSADYLLGLTDVPDPYPRSKNVND